MTTFRFKCYRDLINTLGKLDAVVEFAEVSTREVLSQCGEGEDRRSHIKRLSQKHRVVVDDVDPASVPTRMAQLYILSAYQQAEEFLQAFRSEHPDSGNWSYTSIADGDLLKRVASNIATNFLTATEQLGKLQCSVFELYRLHRNRFMHTDVKTQRIDSLADKLQGDVHAAPEFCKLNAPNHYHDASFDDYILFTRVIKHIAEAMCVVGRPTDAAIAEMLAKRFLPSTLAKLNRSKNNTARRQQKLERILQKEYRLNVVESQPVIHELINGPLA